MVLVISIYFIVLLRGVSGLRFVNCGELCLVYRKYYIDICKMESGCGVLGGIAE